ncbi:hypothetical protein LINPERHAP1_LOCUS12813, partial [Linum perenne]
LFFVTPLPFSPIPPTAISRLLTAAASDSFLSNPANCQQPTLNRRRLSFLSLHPSHPDLRPPPPLPPTSSHRAPSINLPNRRHSILPPASLPPPPTRLQPPPLHPPPISPAKLHSNRGFCPASATPIIRQLLSPTPTSARSQPPIPLIFPSCLEEFRPSPPFLPPVTIFVANILKIGGIPDLLAPKCPRSRDDTDEDAPVAEPSAFQELSSGIGHVTSVCEAVRYRQNQNSLTIGDLARGVSDLELGCQTDSERLARMDGVQQHQGVQILDVEQSQYWQ